MADEYERIRMHAREDPGTAGDAGEENWAELLRRWLPATLHVVTKGRIIYSNSHTSPQVDVLILSPSYPRGLLNKKLYLAAGVLAAFECKNTLRLEHIRRAVRASVAIGDLARRDKSLHHHIVYGLLAHSHGIAAKRRPPEEAIGDALARLDLQEVHNPCYCLDFMCVANLGTWAVLKGFTTRPGKEDSQTMMTAYMGPLDEMMRNIEIEGISHNPDPIGRFLSGLLQRLGRRDKDIAVIAEYFHDAGLFGIGKSQAVRYWDQAELPDEYDHSFL